MFKDRITSFPDRTMLLPLTSRHRIRRNLLERCNRPFWPASNRDFMDFDVTYIDSLEFIKYNRIIESKNIYFLVVE